MVIQMSLEFPDTCLTCKGRGVITSVQTIVTRGHARIIESVRPCRICDAKGIFPKYFMDEIRAKLRLGSSLYGKFLVSRP